MSAGKVVRDDGLLKFDTGNTLVTANCAHDNDGACGGCYARLFLLLLEIQRAPSAATSAINRVFSEMEKDRRGTA